MTHLGEALFGRPQESTKPYSAGNAANATDIESWFAIQTKPRHEKRVGAELEEKGITVFLPVFSEVRQWSDRKRKIELPLFANYLFIRISEDRNVRASVLRTNGVFRFVGVRGVGVPIPDDQIEGIQKIVREKIPFLPYPFFGVGKTVRIRGGSLDGLKGVVLSLNGDQSLIVSIEGIQRSIAIRIAGYQIEAA